MTCTDEVIGKVGVHRVAGGDCAGQILEGVEQRPEAGDLVGLLTDVHLGQDQCVPVVAGDPEVDLPSLRAGRTPQRLPVDHEPSQPLSPGLPVREPGSDRPVQGVRVDSGEQSPDRGFRGSGTCARRSSRSGRSLPDTSGCGLSCSKAGEVSDDASAGTGSPRSQSVENSMIADVHACCVPNLAQYDETSATGRQPTTPKS